MPDQVSDASGGQPGPAEAILQGTGDAWWDEFFADRSKSVPFFTEWPDENLAEWFSSGQLGPGRVLELGCGNGRNAIYLAGRGCTVDAVDFSAQAIGWAAERAGRAGVSVAFHRCSIFGARFIAGSYDFVYDSGCFHHIPPHRRGDYTSLVHRALRPGGSYGLVCFGPDGGSGYTDQQVYERASLGGGLGYSEDQLRALWDKPPFSIRGLRQMHKTSQHGPHFGEDFLQVLLATREASR
jgi:SAM-dependent methyltransferase